MASAAPATRDEAWLLRAIDRYHELCADPALASPDVVVSFAAAQVRLGLTFGGIVQCRSLRPAFITPRSLEALRAVVDKFWNVIRVIEQNALADASLAVQLGLTEQERELIAIDPGYDDATVVSRLDTFFAERPIVIEYNADSPAGMSYQAGQAALMRHLPVFAKFSTEYRLEELRADVALRETLIDVWHEFSARKSIAPRAPLVAIVDVKAAETSAEFGLVAEDFKAHGISTVIATPEDLHLVDGELHAFGRRVDLVYKRLLVADFLAHYDLRHPLVRAYAAGSVCVASSFRCTIAHKKQALAVLYDQHRATLFSNEQHQAIEELVAPTWPVQAFARERLETERLDFVLKPNDAHGGENVFLGWECDAAQWRDALDKAMSGDYVVQRRVRPVVASYPIFDASAPQDGATLTPLLEDRNAYVFRGVLRGILTRLSDSAIINVSRGGQAIPTFVISPANDTRE